MSNVNANTEKPKRDKYTWLTPKLKITEIFSYRKFWYTDIFKRHI